MGYGMKISESLPQENTEHVSDAKFLRCTAVYVFWAFVIRRFLVSFLFMSCIINNKHGDKTFEFENTFQEFHSFLITIFLNESLLN